MSVIATALKHLIAAGVTGDDLVRAVAEMEAATVTCTDATADKRREYDRNRKRAKKLSGGIPVETAESAESGETPPPNDIYSNPPVKPVEAKASTSPFAEKAVSEWNAGPAARGARKAQKLDPARRKQLAARVREFGEDGVLAAIRGIAASDWHCGIGSNGWRANLGWLIEKPKHVSDSIERADEAPASGGKGMTPAEMEALRASLADKPWMRGRESELAQPPPRTPRASHGPRAVGDLMSRITDHAA